MTTLAVVRWFAAWCVAMSFVEHYAHSRVMHRRSVFHRWFPGVFQRHHVEHHGRYYKQFDHEPDEHGRWVNITFGANPNLWLALLAIGASAAYSPAMAIGAVLAIGGHHVVWNAIHSEMHVPSGRWFSRSPVYRWLARHHYVHHRHVNRNFNIVFPLADVVMGTYKRPTQAEREAMKAMGL